MRCLRTVTVLVLLVTTTNCYAKTLVDAIHMVETSGKLGPIRGDNGNALGPLQIHRACWQDANIGGNYSQCEDLDYSKRVFRAYMKRYATKKRLGRTPTPEDMSRIWNGGPNGFKKSNTVKYWNKVQKELSSD